MLTVDQICRAYDGKPLGLTIRMIDDDAEFPMVLVEGSADALEFLAELLLSTARDKNNDGFQMAPFGAGSAYFSLAAKLGVYLHRLNE